MTASNWKPDARSVAALRDVLQDERHHYARLLELVRAQGQMMACNDLEGLHANARLLDEHLAAADAVRIRRELLAAKIIQPGTDDPPRSLSRWLQRQAPEVRQELQGPVGSVRRVADELARANEMNRRLANFCLDLVEEEAALMRRCLLEDPAGCYDRGAKPAQKSQGGVMQHSA